MKKCLLLFTIFNLFFPFFVLSAESNRVSEPLPSLTLMTAGNDNYRTYLGLSDSIGESFTLDEIQADILLIELFSMYCPFCQKEAPLVNELFKKMGALSDKGLIVKIIGLGASNSQFEVDHFRETYDVAFPVFPDKDMSMYNALKGAGTPGFLGVRLKEGESGTIVLRNSGGFYSSDDFLKELIEESGL